MISKQKTRIMTLLSLIEDKVKLIQMEVTSQTLSLTFLESQFKLLINIKEGRHQLQLEEKLSAKLRRST